MARAKKSLDRPDNDPKHPAYSFGTTQIRVFLEVEQLLSLLLSSKYQVLILIEFLNEMLLL